MSEALPNFQLLQPATVEAAVAALEKDNCARLYAGGTDLMVNMRRGLVDAKTLIDISAIADLKRIGSANSGLFVGAGVSLRELAENKLVAKHYRAIHEACLAVAGPGHREVATVAGNLCLDTRCVYYNQSHWWRKANDFCLKYRGEICHVAPTKNVCRAAFCGDLAPALMVHGAELEIVGTGGRRRVALDKFYREDGAHWLRLEATEIIVGVHLPRARGVSAYRKVRLRGAIDFPLAGIAIACEERSPSRHLFTLAVTGTNSCPVMVDIPDALVADDNCEAFFADLVKRVQMRVSPLRTTTTAANYRRVSISAIAGKLAEELWQE
jgi:4-hydroxybenzoyl-CoA reductase subunit beta